MLKNCKTESQNMPSGWIYAELGEILPLQYGKALPEKKRIDTGNYPVYGSSGQVGSHESQIATGPCLIVGRKGSAGKVFYSIEDCWPIDTVYFSKANCQVSLRFMYYCLQFLRLDQLDNSTAIPSLSREAYNKVKIPLPPLAEQHRIVDKIERFFSYLDEGEALLKQVQQQIITYRQAVLKAAVTGELTKEWREANQHRLESGKELHERILEERRKNWQGRGKYKEPEALDVACLPDLPKGWTWVTVESLCKNEKYSIKAGPFGSALKKEFYTEKGYKIYGQEQVISGDWKIGNYYVNEQKFRQLESCKVKPLDILISFVGTIGKVLVLPSEIESGIINPRLIKISLSREIYCPFFFKYYFESEFLKSIYKLDAHGATMDVLNLDIIKKLPFVLCSLEEQEEIVSRLNDVFSQIQTLGTWCKTELARSIALRQSILKAAFSGTLH